MNVAALLAGVRWITFDCYGTLIDWETGILGAVRPILGRASDSEILSAYAASEARHEAGAYRTYREVLAGVMEDLAERFDVVLGPGRRSAIADSLARWPAFEDTGPALRVLKAGFRLAVISNIDNDLFAATAPKLGVELDALITAQECRSYKPSLNNFRVAMERMGAGAGEMLHVAESVRHDIEPARQLGVRCVWVNRRRGKAGVGASGAGGAAADLEVASLAELVSLMPIPRRQ